MKSSLLKNFFSSGVQAVAVQVLGGIFFFVVADYLSKDDFGIINWANATSVIVATFVGFGLEQVVIRRIAKSKSSDWAAAAYLFHTFISSIIAFSMLLLVTTLFSAESEFYVRVHYLPWFFGVQAIVYIGIPLKQFLNAKQNFTPYALIAIISNVVKIVLVIIFVNIKELSIITVGVILGICTFIELASLLTYILIKTDFNFRFKAKAYFKLIKESFPQYMSSIFDTGLSRIDWILLGILSTTAITAEYSVAYKAFEISRLPVSIIAPIILNIFAKKMIATPQPGLNNQKLISDLYTLEIFFALLIPLILNILWTPVVDYFFKNKYGNVNAIPFMVLSVSIPLIFIINLLWTMAFSVKKYKQLSIIIVIGAILNLILNLILIPRYDATGAAVAFLLTIIAQIFFYYRLVHKYLMKFSIVTLCIFYIMAISAYIISNLVSDNIFMKLFIALSIYIGLSVLTKNVTKEHLQTVKSILRK